MPERQQVTQRQINGLKQRLIVDENDYVEFEAKVGDAQVWCWANEQKVYVTGNQGLSGQQVLELKAVLEQAHDFLTYGPGEWVGEGADRHWVSGLDEDGNDQPVPEEES